MERNRVRVRIMRPAPRSVCCFYRAGYGAAGLMDAAKQLRIILFHTERP